MLATGPISPEQVTTKACMGGTSKLPIEAHEAI